MIPFIWLRLASYFDIKRQNRWEKVRAFDSVRLKSESIWLFPGGSASADLIDRLLNSHKYQ